MAKDRKIGKSFPLGTMVCPDGVNFSVFAKGGEAAQLLLFDHVDDAQPSRTIGKWPPVGRARRVRRRSQMIFGSRTLRLAFLIQRFR